jgi:hypothetical protein
MPSYLDDQLPLGTANFRKFAPAMADKPVDTVAHARSAMGSLMRTRAVVFGVDVARDVGSKTATEKANQLILAVNAMISVLPV